MVFDAAAAFHVLTRTVFGVTIIIAILKVYSCGDLAFSVRCVKGNFGIETHRTTRSTGWDGDKREMMGGWFRKKDLKPITNHI